MRIWLIQIGEPLPTDGPVRLLRTGILASMLVERGHNVTWWAATFDHTHKNQRQPADFTTQLDERYRIEMLHARGYRRNISLDRIRYHCQIAYRLASRIRAEAPPDIILASLPTAESALVALRYALKHSVPFVVDVRDHWPEIFLDVVPPSLRWLAHLALWPAFRANWNIFRHATGITSISLQKLEWGLSYAGRGQRETDQVFYMGYPKPPISPTEKQAARETWLARGVSRDKFVCCFFGSIGPQFDLETVIAAARALEMRGDDTFQFVLCGEGSHLEGYRQRTCDLGNVLLPGWVDVAEITALMELSKVGLACYAANSSMSLPNKPFEYLAGGLPVLSSLRGELELMLAEENCGLTYEAGSVEDLLDKLHYLCDFPQRRLILSRNARRLFEERFSAERVYTVMIDYLEALARSADVQSGKEVI